MSDKPISDAAIKQLEIFGTEESGDLSPLLKPPHSKNITLADWNELIHSSDRNFADVRRVYDVLKKTLPELENYTTEQVAAILTTIQAINTTLGQHQDRLTSVSERITSVDTNLSANFAADAAFKNDTSNNFKAQDTRINTAFNDIAQLNKADVAKISVEDTGNFGVYTLRISFNDGRSVSTEFDLPLEAVQIASVDDTFIDDERCLVITFVDENVTPLVVKLDEIFNIEALESLTRPYDVATERVMLYYQQTYLKLTIDNLLDGHYESFQPFDMVCLGSDGYPMSALCTVTVESYDSVKMLVYNTKSVADNLCPKYYTSEDGNVYLYFDTYYEHLQVFIRGLVEKCTGATLEIVDALPDGAMGINIEKHLNEDYVSYTANGVTQKRPIGDTPQAHGIVCRNEDKGIEVRSLESGETYADNEAVPLSYIRDTMLPTAGGGGNANIDVTAKVGQTIIVKEVDANGKPTKWESADYQERICWTGETVILPETTVEAEDNGEGLMVAMLPAFTLVCGDKYLVNYNGAEYECECLDVSEDGSTVFVMGNLGSLGLADTGEPFVMQVVPSEEIYATIPLDGATIVTVSIAKVEVTPIPEKYVTNALPFYIEATAENPDQNASSEPINYNFITPASTVAEAFNSGRELKLRVRLTNYGQICPIVYNLACGTALGDTAGVYLFVLPYSDYGNAHMAALSLSGAANEFLYIGNAADSDKLDFIDW